MSTEADKKAQAQDLGTLRVKYASYLRKMYRNPDTAVKALSFKQWLKARKAGKIE